MSKDENETAEAEAPKKSKKMLMIIVIAVVVLAGGGGGAYFMFFRTTTPKAPVKGAVVALKDALTINLADAHYLKLGFALQMTEEAGTEAIDTSQAVDLAITQYTGMEIAELETEKGREKAKNELLEKIEKVYNVDKKDLVMGIYFTQYVTQ